MREEKLTGEDVKLLQEGIRFNRKLANGSLKNGGIVTFIAPLLGYTLLGFNLQYMLLLFFGLAILTLYIWYFWFERPKLKLIRDLEIGLKIVEVATVKKIKSSNTGKIYRMSNGLEVQEGEFDDNDDMLGVLKKGTELMLAYTPNHKFILNIKRLNTSLIKE